MTEPSNKIVTFLPKELAEQARLCGTEAGFMSLCEALGFLASSLPKESFYRTVLFGSARITEKHPLYASAKDFGYQMALHGIDLVTGGGPGIMAAANAGVIEAKEKQKLNSRSYGVSIGCYPTEKRNEFLEKEYKHGHYATRLLHFVRLGRSFVVEDGGIGTLLELAWIWQLLQANQLKDCPLILVGDMWAELFAFMEKRMVSKGYLRSEEMNSVTLVPTIDLAIPIVVEHYRQFKAELAAG